MKKLIIACMTVFMLLTLVAGCGKKEEEVIDDEPKNQLEAIRKNGKMVVGVEGTYYPFTYHDETTNELTGFDIEIAKIVAQGLGVEAEFVESDWDSLLVALDTKKVDTVINDVTATDERRLKYDFTNPYFYYGRQVVVKTGNEVGMHSLEDFKGKKVATNTTNSWVPRMEELGAIVVPIDTTDQCAQAVITGRADFCMLNAIVLGEYLLHHPDAPLEVAFLVEGEINHICIPVRKGEKELLTEIDRILDELRSSGKLAELSLKYFGLDYTNDPFAN